MKIRYIESSPIKQVREFENREEYNTFFQQRIKEIMDYTYPNNIDFYEYFIYKSVGLNKDGNPRKQIDPSKWLMSEKSKKKRKKNFAIYCEKRKKQTKETSFRRKLAEIDSKIEFWQKEKDMLIENHKKEIEK